MVENDDKTTSFYIDCNDAGVEFTHAVAGGLYVADILGPKYIPEIVSSSSLNDTMNYEGLFKPVLGVQVTELEDGIFLACTANHVEVDGTSSWHFLYSWSEISRGSDRVSKSPTFERWFRSSSSDENRRVNLPPIDQKPSNKFVPPALLQRVFRFSKDSLAKLKGKANNEAGCSKISILQALLADLWRGVLRCRRQQNKTENFSEEEIYFDLVVGARTRIPLQDGYFENAAYYDRISAAEQDVLQKGLGFAAQKIHELVLRQTTDAASKFVEDWLEAPAIINKGLIRSIISSSPRHDVYGCDFGWGKPIAVRSGKGQKIDGKMTLYPAAKPGDIDVEVCLAPETLKITENDEEFMEAVTI